MYWKQPKCPSTDKWIKKMWYIHTMEYYSAIKTTEITPLAKTIPSHGRGLWPRDVLKKVSQGLSRAEAGNPGFPRLVQVTSGGFSWWL